MNIWFWLFLLMPPLLVFSAKPESPAWWRVGRLLLAIAAGYFMINFTLQYERNLEWETFEACQKLFGGGPDQQHPNCHVDIADNGALTFYALLGWIPALGLTGFFELMWRVLYRRRIHAANYHYVEKFFSNMIMAAAALSSFITYDIISIWFENPF